jgi:hypothetical protein
MKSCPSGKILNPEIGRCVLIEQSAYKRVEYLTRRFEEEDW